MILPPFSTTYRSRLSPGGWATSSGASNSPTLARRTPPPPSPTGGAPASRAGAVAAPVPVAVVSSSSPHPAATEDTPSRRTTTAASGPALLLDLDPSLVVDPGLGWLRGDGDDELAARLAPVAGHRPRLAVKSGGDLVVHGVRAAANRGHLPDHLTPVAGVERAERICVGRRDGARRGAERPALAGQTRVLVLEHPHGTVGVGEPRLLEPDVERALRAVVDEDRHREVGDRLVAGVLDAEPQVRRLGEPLPVRELGGDHVDRELGLGLVGVLALAPSTASGDGEDTEPCCKPRSDPPPVPPSGGCAVRPQGGLNIPRASWPARRLERLWVAGAGAIKYPSPARSDPGPGGHMVRG